MRRRLPASDPGRGNRGRRRGVLIVVLALLTGTAVGFFSAQATISPADVADEASEPVLVEVIEGTVERFQSFTAQGQWDLIPVATAGLPGTVTSVATSPGVPIAAGQGTALYGVNLSPVVVFAGAVPAFRDLDPGLTGDDVRQLQEGLAALGFGSGASDGRFDSGVTAAVRAWQRSLGIEATGIVPRGQVRFVPTLPANLVLTDSMQVGRELSGAEDAILMLPPAPRFSIPLNSDQRDLVPQDAPVVITHPEGQWSAVVASATEAVENGQSVLRLTLAAPDGGPLCADRCDLVPALGVSNFPAQIVLVPTQTGPVVPAAAIQTDAAGATTVLMSDGSARDIVVLAQAQGQAVVDGVEVGEQVRLPELTR